MKLKRWLIGCAALMLSVGTAHAGGFVVSKVEANQGETVRIDVRSGDLANISVMQFTLNYVNTGAARAPDLVPFGNVTSPDFGDEGATVNVEGGKISFRYANSAGFDGSGLLLSAFFTVPSDSPRGARYNFQIRDVQVTDKNGEKVSVYSEPGQVVLRNEPSAAKVTASSAFARSGETGVVRIQATDLLKRVSGLQFTLKYDPKLGVTKEDVILGSFLKGNVTVNIPEPGTLTFAVSSSAAKDGPGEIARVAFLLPTNLTPLTTFPIQVKDVKVTGPYGPPYAAAGLDGQIVIPYGDDRDIPGLPDTSFSALPSVIKVRSGGIARVDMYAYGVTKNLSAASFRLIVIQKTPANAPDLQFSHFTPGSLLPDATVQTDAKKAGELSVVMASPGKANGPGRLISLNFRVPEKGTKNAIYSLSVEDFRVSIDGKDYRTGANAGIISVTARLKGDVANAEQGDGAINALDAIAVLQILLGTRTANEDQMQAADTNCDTQVTLSDAVSILRHIVGLERFCDESEPDSPVEAITSQ